MKTKSTKKALLASLLSLVVCVSMLVGSTFAWFTDSVTSANNIIKSGNLDVTLEWMDGKDAPADPDDAAWKDASTDAIFDYNLWEPGYTTVRHIKIGNEGSLALKYKVVIEANGSVSDLTDVIDVYYFDPAQQIADRTALAGVTPMGTLTSVLGNMSTTAQGELAANTDDVITIALKMKETAGNEYMNKQVGDSFTIKVFATQLAAESDSFGNDYDVFADYDGEISTPSALEAALKNGGTYKVISDITVTEAMTVPAGVNVELDLNGKTITNNNGYVFENKGDLVISGNGTVSGLGFIRSTAGTVTIEDGNFYASSRWQDGVYQHTLKAENSDVVINGGNFDATVNGQTNAMFNASSNGTITINGGTFKNVSGALQEYDPYIFTYEKNGKVVINDGSFYGGWRFNGETATTDIYGGDFELSYDGQSFHATSTHTVTVYGGNFAADAKFTKNQLNNTIADGYSVLDNGDGTYTVAKGVAANNQTALDNAIKGGEESVVLAAGNYSMLDGSDVNLQGKTLTITGTKATVIDVSDVDTRDQFVTGASLVFEGVTLNFNDGSGNIYMGFANTKSLIYKNCKITGMQFLYGENVTFENCVIDSSANTGEPHSVWTYGAKNINFIDCYFIYGDRAVNCFKDQDIDGGKQVVNFKNCTFTTTKNDSEGAVEINSSTFSVGIEVNLDGCTAPANGDMVFISKWDGTDGAMTTINVNGAKIDNATVDHD